MSKDIRSYFCKGTNAAKSKEKPESPQGKKRHHRVIESDDESDDFIVSKKKPKESPTSSKSKSEKKKQEVIVQVETFFGSKPVQQKLQKISTKKPTETKPKPPSRKQKKNTKEKENNATRNDVSFEFDDELDASLLQTDDEQLLLSVTKQTSNETVENKKEVVVQEQRRSPRKQNKTTPNKKETENIKPLSKKVEVKKQTPVKESDTKKKTPNKEVNVEIKSKTPKHNQSVSDSSLISSEQKRKNAEAYQRYLNRSGPKNPGSKTIPKGTPTCLQGLTFVITGVLDSLEREEATELIQKCGGRITGSVSKKTDYVVVGEEPGVSKIQKADNFGTKKINEDELLDLIRVKSGVGKEDSFIESTPEKGSSKYFQEKTTPKKRAKKIEEVKEELVSPKKIKVEEKKEKLSIEKKDKFPVEKKDTPPVERKPVPEPKTEPGKPDFGQMEKTAGDMLWVDKYRPKSTKNIIGQAGDKSAVKKLIKWLQNWHKNHASKTGSKPARPAPWAQSDDGGYFKAALLSGPPGVGKTTTVHLVCKELGFDIIEFNASDTRSKRLLQEEVSELLSTKSIRGFFQGSGDNFQKHVLVMDEVDGMAGNEDRGGIQELIQLIKNTKVPIVGICNDRSHPKMRSLVNYCFDVRFQRPRVEQIKGAMKSICFKENLDISGEALEALIISSNHDVRQVLHNLSLLASGHKTLTLEEAKKKGEQAKKPLNLGPWDVVRKVFSASEQEKMSFMDKSDLFFQDYSLGPLFVQDTYLRVVPHKAKNCKRKKLELISKAADSLVLGDVVERTIRSSNSWSLLPVQAVFSSVLPGYHMRGHIQGQVQFPLWFGKNSRSNKFDRLLQELNSSLRINITGSKQSVNLDYLHHLKNAIVEPLVTRGADGVQESLRFMLDYHLTREDLDSILELTTWPGMKDSFLGVDSKVKAALTRALNKESQAIVSTKKSGKIKGNADNFEMEEGEGEDDVEEDSENIAFDPMIKVGKAKPKKEAAEKDKKEKKEKKGAAKKETKKGKK